MGSFIKDGKLHDPHDMITIHNSVDNMHSIVFEGTHSAVSQLAKEFQRVRSMDRIDHFRFGFIREISHKKAYLPHDEMELLANLNHESPAIQLSYLRERYALSKRATLRLQRRIQHLPSREVVDIVRSNMPAFFITPETQQRLSEITGLAGISLATAITSARIEELRDLINLSFAPMKVGENLKQ